MNVILTYFWNGTQRYSYGWTETFAGTGNQAPVCWSKGDRSQLCPLFICHW